MDSIHLPQDREKETCHGTSGSIKRVHFSGLRHYQTKQIFGPHLKRNILVLVEVIRP